MKPVSPDRKRAEAVAGSSRLGGFAAVAMTWLRRPLAHLLPLDVPETESLMNLSPLGTLHCICGTNGAQAVVSDRRQTCRTCGHEVAEADRSLLFLELSPAEIRQRVKKLRELAVLAKGVELPIGVADLGELEFYLVDAAAEPKGIRSSRADSVQVQPIH